MQILDLNGFWKFKARNAYGTLPAAHRKATEWMSATVPGTVHTDLLANDVIQDPFFGMNEKDVQWVDSQQWVYRREFRLPPTFLKEGRITLVADGLDTFATVFCNGKKVGQTANMFIGHRLDIKRFLHPGGNTLEIIFDSPLIRCTRSSSAATANSMLPTSRIACTHARRNIPSGGTGVRSSLPRGSGETSEWRHTPLADCTIRE